MRIAAVLFSLVLILPVAGARACDLALAFALDVSGSVNPAEHRLQREGLAGALLDPDVVTAVKAQPGGVALMVYEWAGARWQTPIAYWRLAKGEAELAAVAADVLSAPRSAKGATAIGPAMFFGALMIDYETDCQRRVIDISGDGIHNNGYRPHEAWGMPAMASVTVNALVIEGSDPDVLDYYVSQVIGGAGAFVEIAAGFEDYAVAIRRKLLRELTIPVAER
jgi:hypothetical protein